MSKIAGQQEASPLTQAQELIYQAWESEDPAERVELAGQALEVSAECADAWVLLAEERAASLAEMLGYYRKGVDAGERALGAKAFEREKGRFWGLLATRPYMRARLGLAQCLWTRGDRDAAIAHYQEMLELNPNDNQGVRHVLLTCLLDEGRHEEAEQLIQGYANDPSAVWAYSRALLAFRCQGDNSTSRGLRARAVAQNRFVPGYLVGRRKMPKGLPDYFGLGDKNEAIAYVLDNRKTWRSTPGAIPWLLKAG